MSRYGAPTTHQHAKEKQFRVESDVKCSAVCGHTMWLAHNDGTVTVRRTRTAETIRHFTAGCGARVWSMVYVNLSANSNSSSSHGAGAAGTQFMWLGLSNGDIEVHSVDKSDAMATQRGIDPTTAAQPKDKQATALRQSTGAATSLVTRLQRHTGGIYTLTEFNGLVFSGSNDFEIMQWDAASCSFMKQFTGHTNYVRCLHAEGSLLLSSSDDHTVRIWNSVTGQLLSCGRFHKQGVSTLCRVGLHVWSGDDSGVICVWKLQTLELEDTLTEHLGRITAIKKVGARVYSGAADHEILIWDAFHRTVVTRINDHRGWILNLSCPAQLCRYYVWSAGADGSVRCWHHDEYRVMSSEFERFDDARWFHAGSTPFKDLNNVLIDRLKSLEAKCLSLTNENCTNAVAFKESSRSAADTKLQVGLLMDELGELKTKLEDSERLSEQRRQANETKETELTDLSAKIKSFTVEAVDTKCKKEGLTEEIAELKRKLDVAETERDTYKDALDRTLATKKESFAALTTADGSAVVDPMDAGLIGVKPLILTTPSEATEAVEKLAKELGNARAVNLTLRAEAARQKTIVEGAALTTQANALRQQQTPPRRGGSSPLMSVVKKTATTSNSKPLHGQNSGSLSGLTTTTNMTTESYAYGGYGGGSYASGYLSDRYNSAGGGSSGKSGGGGYGGGVRKPSAPQSARRVATRKAF